MSSIALINEPYPHAVKAKRTNNGIVKFPVNVHSIRVELETTGLTRLVASQNGIDLSFILDDEDCQHLAALLIRSPIVVRE